MIFFFLPKHAIPEQDDINKRHRGRLGYRGLEPGRPVKFAELVFTEELKGASEEANTNSPRKNTENINCEMGLIGINYRFNCYFDLIQCVCWDSANFP
jgi:hypothetical protein